MSLLSSLDPPTKWSDNTFNKAIYDKQLTAFRVEALQCDFKKVKKKHFSFLPESKNGFVCSEASFPSWNFVLHWSSK
jgi:hypothetical protein